ncbi:flagellar biosynthetic protein FliR [Algirhabdus cladophorae]|uniref:flagellar biosynthetic protein FliR n=1 Tax=Algirhabdus cladophorae TaxID=3377108 RepID=UPI003B849465
MMELLTSVLGWTEQTLFIGFVVFARIGATVFLLPAFGEQSVPARVKLAMAVSFTLIVAPAVYPQIELALAQAGPLSILFPEVVVGLALGVGVRLFVLGLQTAGAIAAQSTSLSQIFGGAGVDPQPAISHILVVSGLALAVLLDLHVRVALMMVSSYDLLPVGQFPDRDFLTMWGVSVVAQVFALAFTLAAPFVIGSMIYNAALGVINKAMPQLMVAFVGAPAITGASIFLLAVSAPFLLSLWIGAMNAFISNPFG